MGHKVFEVDFTLGSETDREFVVTRLGWGAYVRVGELVMKKKGPTPYRKEPLTLSSFTNSMVMGITTSAAPIPTWRCKSEIETHSVKPPYLNICPTGLDDK